MTRLQIALFWRLWVAVCRMQKWKVSDTERRHAVVREALGVWKSSRLLSNAEFDRVKRALVALAHPEDVGAIAAVMDADRTAEEDERRRLVWRICAELKKGGLAEGYAAAIAREQFDSPRWRQLPLGALRRLRLTLIERVRARARRAMDMNVEETL